jgi:hypothetical protein
LLSGPYFHFKHATDGKEVKTPGLGWFAHIVRGAIIGYLDSVTEESARNEEIIAELAFEKAILKIKSKKSTVAGEIATYGDIEYR